MNLTDFLARCILKLVYQEFVCKAAWAAWIGIESQCYFYQAPMPRTFNDIIRPKAGVHII